MQLSLYNDNTVKTQQSSSLNYDAIVIGGCISGLYQLYRLRELGLQVRVLKMGTGVDGTWYWNRYLGARFDSQSYSYGYSFSHNVLYERDWLERFAGQPVTELYLNQVADKFDLKKDIEFLCRVASAHIVDQDHCWLIQTDNDQQFKCRFLITAIGALLLPTMPRFKGMDAFKGPSVHTGLQPKEQIEFTGKRVAVIGTCASGVQTIKEFAKVAEHLAALQQRPNWCTPLNNDPIDETEMEQIRAGYPELFEHCRNTTACFVHSVDTRGTFEVTEGERTEFWETLYSGKGFGIWQGDFRDVLINPEANKLLLDFAADNIRNRVQDQNIAELLIPKNHSVVTRRVPQETFYYEVHN